jgi:hypothetical protein
VACLIHLRSWRTFAFLRASRSSFAEMNRPRQIGRPVRILLGAPFIRAFFANEWRDAASYGFSLKILRSGVLCSEQPRLRTPPVPTAIPAEADDQFRTHRESQKSRSST